MPHGPIRLVAFDLDGTLLRGETVCEVLARPLGRLDRMREFESLREAVEIEAARGEMACWYAAVPPDQLLAPLESLRLAPGVREGFRLLKRHGVGIAIVSITWEFAAAWFARRLGADYAIGTRLGDGSRIAHFWPRDKARWVSELARQLGLESEGVAAVGDSWGDLDMLRAVGQPFFVGRATPAGVDGLRHLPDGDIRTIARRIVRIGEPR